MTRPLRLLCYVLLAFGLAVAVYSAALRVQADAKSNRVLVLVDWRELNELQDVVPENATVETSLKLGDGGGVATRTSVDEPITDRASHKIPWDLLARIPNAQLAYGEETVGDLLEEGILSPADVSATSATFEVSDFNYQLDILKGANRHGYLSEYHAGKLLVQIPQPGTESVSGQPLCWRSDVIALAKSKSVKVVLRPMGTELLDRGGLEETLRFSKDQPVMLFEGTQVLGFPYELKNVADSLKKNHQQFGWVEFDDQDSGAQLASMMAPNVARVHSITADEMEKYTIERAVARFELAVKERGIRVLFLRPFTKPGLNKTTEPSLEGAGYTQKLAYINLMYFSAIADMLKDNGFTIGVPKRFSSPPRWLSKVRAAAITLATTAGALLLLTVLVPLLSRRWASAILVLGVLAAAGCVFVHTLYSLVLLATGIIFPTLGFWLAMDVYQRGTGGKAAASTVRVGYALVGLLVATACSAAGGLLIHGGMWDARALLHIDQYRGVTIALAVPVLLIAAYCWQAETLQEAWDSARRELASFWQRFTALWYAPIRYGDVAIILIVVGALGVMLLRSGNEGPVGVIAGEGSFRAFLEHALAVRPRTKELLGHPLLVLFLVTLPWRSRLSLLFALAGIVGQVSVLNTFEHLHTPLLITLQRVGIGLLIGVVIGAVLGLVAIMISRLVARPESRIQSLSDRAEPG